MMRMVIVMKQNICYYTFYIVLFVHHQHHFPCRAKHDQSYGIVPLPIHYLIECSKYNKVRYIITRLCTCLYKHDIIIPRLLFSFFHSHLSDDCQSLTIKKRESVYLLSFKSVLLPTNTIITSVPLSALTSSIHFDVFKKEFRSTDLDNVNKGHHPFFFPLTYLLYHKQPHTLRNLLYNLE